MIQSKHLIEASFDLLVLGLSLPVAFQQSVTGFILEPLLHHRLVIRLLDCRKLELFAPAELGVRG